MYVYVAEEIGRYSSLGRSLHFTFARKVFRNREEKKGLIFCNRNTMALIVQHDQIDTKSRCM